MDNLIKMKHGVHELKSRNSLKLFKKGEKRLFTIHGWGIKMSFKTDT
jgi:hypothetical protein